MNKKNIAFGLVVISASIGAYYSIYRHLSSDSADLKSNTVTIKKMPGNLQAEDESSVVAEDKNSVVSEGEAKELTQHQILDLPATDPRKVALVASILAEGEARTIPERYAALAKLLGLDEDGSDKLFFLIAQKKMLESMNDAMRQAQLTELQVTTPPIPQATPSGIRQMKMILTGNYGDVSMLKQNIQEASSLPDAQIQALLGGANFQIFNDFYAQSLIKPQVDNYEVQLQATSTQPLSDTQRTQLSEVIAAENVNTQAYTITYINDAVIQSASQFLTPEQLDQLAVMKTYQNTLDDFVNAAVQQKKGATGKK